MISSKTIMIRATRKLLPTSFCVQSRLKKEPKEATLISTWNKWAKRSARSWTNGPGSFFSRLFVILLISPKTILECIQRFKSWIKREKVLPQSQGSSHGRWFQAFSTCLSFQCHGDMGHYLASHRSTQ